MLCSSLFVLCLSFEQVLCNLAGVVLELLSLDEICVPLPSSLVHVIRDLALPHDVLQHRLVFELFLREDVYQCKALLLRTFLGFDLRLVRLILDSVFRSSPGPSGQFHIAHQSRCSFRFTRLLLLCVGAVSKLVTSVAIHLASHPATNVRLQMRCQLDAAVRHLNSSPSEPCSFSLQLVSLRLESRLRPLFGPPGGFFASFCCPSTATASRCAVCSWTYHTASQDLCRSWLHREPVASLRPVHDRLAQTG